MELEKIMNEPATRQELENKLSIINTLLPNSEGFLKALRLHEKEKLEIQLALFDNVAPEDEIIVNVEDESPITIEMDTYDIRDLEINTVRPPRTANEILANKQNPKQGIVLGLAGTY